MTNSPWNIDEAVVGDQYASLVFSIRTARLRLMMISGVALLIMVSTLYLAYFVSTPPRMLTIISDTKGVVNNVQPVINPRVTDKQAIEWANDATAELLSLHFKRYEQQLEYRKRLFVGGGWDLYRASLIENEVISSIVEKGLIITAGNSDTPRLVRKAKVEGQMNWYLEIPVYQTIVGARDGSITVQKYVAIAVQETRRDEALEGLKVRLFNIKK